MSYLDDALKPQDGEEFGEWLGRAVGILAGGDIATSLLGRDRPYDGQPHTDEGIRGATEVRGVTFRDIKDCFVIGAFLATGKPRDEWPDTVFDLDWSDLDPMAVSQNMLCEIEKRMGIYPNVSDAALRSQPLTRGE